MPEANGYLKPQAKVTYKPAKTPQSVGAPYEYPETDVSAGYLQREPARASGSVTGTITSSGTTSTDIETLGGPYILQHYSLSFGIRTGTLGTVCRARIEVRRGTGGPIIFSAGVALAAAGTADSITGSPNIVIYPGDVLVLVYAGTMTACDIHVFGSLVLQPYR